jgi:hypothetical protein
MSRIFISYRRADSADVAGRIFDRLLVVFGAPNVFKDVDSIPPGSDFADVIDETLSKCDSVIVVIGPRWLMARKGDKVPRLHEPRDFVRLEIEKALSKKLLLIPALIGNASMPAEEELPESIRRLARRNAVTIRSDPDFHRDMDRLIHALQKRSEQRARSSAGPGSHSAPVSDPPKRSLTVGALATLASAMAFLLTTWWAFSAAFLEAWDFSTSSFWLLLLSLSQAMIIFPIGTGDYNAPLASRYRWLPVLASCTMILSLTVLIAINLVDVLIRPLFAQERVPLGSLVAFVLITGLAATILWCVTLYSLSREWSRILFAARLWQCLMSTSLIAVFTLLITIAFRTEPDGRFSAKSFGFLMLGILFSLGPLFLWLLMRWKNRVE